MTKRNKRELQALLNGSLFLFGLFLIYKYSLEWYLIFVFLIFSSIIAGMIVYFIPNKAKMKKQNNNQKIHSKKIINNKEILKKAKSEKELLTLPLYQLNGYDFEELCFLYYKNKGMNPIKTKKGADGGVDLIVTSKKYNEKIAIQIKHRKDKISSSEIQKLYGAKSKYNCLLAEFITSGEYSKPALQEAKRLKIQANTAGHIIHWRQLQAKTRKYA